ncbi:hypothetical protein ACLB2K_061175 [Fragaria x ananassa]
MISTSAPFTEERRRGTRARMAEDTLQVPRVQLGFQLVSKLGFGYTGFTGIDNSAPVSEELTLSIIKHAFDKGITFFHTNEVLVGKGQLRLRILMLMLVP